MRKGLFSLGRVVATPGAQEALAAYGNLGLRLLVRHVTGDRGDVCEADAVENDLSVAEDYRILSAYHLPDDQKIWIITEADRSATTFLLPEEY